MFLFPFRNHGEGTNFCTHGIQITLEYHAVIIRLFNVISFYDDNYDFIWWKDARVFILMFWRTLRRLEDRMKLTADWGDDDETYAPFLLRENNAIKGKHHDLKICIMGFFGLFLFLSKNIFYTKMSDSWMILDGLE